MSARSVVPALKLEGVPYCERERRKRGLGEGQPGEAPLRSHKSLLRPTGEPKPQERSAKRPRERPDSVCCDLATRKSTSTSHTRTKQPKSNHESPLSLRSFKLEHTAENNKRFRRSERGPKAEALLESPERHRNPLSKIT